MKELKPLPDKKEYYEAIEKLIRDFFRDELYLPILKEIGLSKKTLRNSLNDLLSAIHSGQIQYVSGHFEGRFTSTLSRELRKLGAKWDRKQGSWKVPFNSLPIEVKSEISVSKAKFDQMAAKVDRKLARLVPEELAEKINLSGAFDSTIFKVDRDIRSTMKAIQIQPALTPEQRKRISIEYAKSLQLPIQDFIQKEVQELRGKISQNVYTGFRYETMVKDIQERYGVSTNKAKFLARQETSLLMAKFKQTRYESAGVRKYKWKSVVGSAKHPVRPMHKMHDGKIFEWTNPPVVNKKGDRKNPGQDYNCRCMAIPLVEF